MCKIKVCIYLFYQYTVTQHSYFCLYYDYAVVNDNVKFISMSSKELIIRIFACSPSSQRV